MSDNTEAALAALATHIATSVPDFVTTGRRFKPWDQVEKQPALFIRHTGGLDDFGGKHLGRTWVEVEIWIYAKATFDPNVAPDTELNALITAVRECFKPDWAENNLLTLGGLVEWVRIEGKSDFDSGEMDGQSKAVLEARMLLAPS